ncbi:TIGR00645 family protein [Methylobacterium sp. J-090]|uniref:TIGR00645 family protein n=1 Tax=Methylobacterium sp. J-090 TaxID=2836666 RepID=UPI001FBAE726|nr:TIGR00645 family protein [Methylobacterium sp. J-090]MCJ2080224.1 TIGR00645 family protein [Methylobacterium sp. J-090]
MMERVFERVLFASRWLLAPFYAALGIGIVVLLVKLLQELAHFVLHMWDATESQVVLGVLTMVDLSLTASLLIIVMFSGYENFVSKIDHADHKDWPAWMGTIDFTGLKLKLVSSIVAISAISLLKAFMDLKAMSDRDLYWLVGIHMVFVVSGLLMALTDRVIAGHHER